MLIFLQCDALKWIGEIRILIHTLSHSPHSLTLITSSRGAVGGQFKILEASSRLMVDDVVVVAVIEDFVAEFLVASKRRRELVSTLLYMLLHPFHTR